MPALTRAAARRLAASGDLQPVVYLKDLSQQHARGEGRIEVKSLRLGVTDQADRVWRLRGEKDLYTQMTRTVVDELQPQVDHVMEVQLVEQALVDALVGTGAVTAQARDVELCHTALSLAVNGPLNLNVTTRRVNQAKRGPFTAGIRRLYSGTENGVGSGRSLRVLTLEQLARQGKARPLVDDGTWARIEKEVAKSYDLLAPQVASTLEPGGGKSEAMGVVAMESLHTSLEKLGIL